MKLHPSSSGLGGDPAKLSAERPSIEDGFKFWREEVELGPESVSDEPYIPVLALAGLYVVLQSDRNRLTSYHWRQQVLASQEALTGIRLSLASYFADDIDDDFPSQIVRREPQPGSSGQARAVYDSLMDGLPADARVIPVNEEFLATALGRSKHDHAIWFRPLEVLPQGHYAIKSFYPETAAYIEEYS